MKYPKIAKYLNEIYIEEIIAHQGRFTQADMARKTNQSQQVISKLMLGNNRPSNKTMDAIASVYGPGIYDACDVPRRMPPDPMVAEILANWHKLTESEKNIFYDDVIKAAERYDKKHGKK